MAKDKKDIIGGLEYYFNNTIAPIIILLEQSRESEVLKSCEGARQLFIDGIERLGYYTEDEQLQAHIEDLRRTAEKMDWINLVQLEQFSKSYQKVREIYLD